MRVLLIVPGFPRLSETFIVNKFLGLLERGWDVHVTCTKKDAEEWASFHQLSSRPKLLDRVHVSWPHRPRWLAALLTGAAVVRCLLHNTRGTWQYLSHGWQLFGADVLRRLYLDAEIVCLNPDIIHFEFGALAVERTYLKTLLNTKLAVSFRGYDLNYAGLDDSSYYWCVWEETDALHLLGDDLWQRARLRGCPPDKLHALIPPAVDATFYDPGERPQPDAAGTSERPLRILSVGRLDWRKGYEYALQTVQHLSSQSVTCQYRIVGDGDYLEPVAFARHQLGVGDVVELLGAQTRDEVKRQMLWADVLLHAAVSEGFCNAVIEAQAMGLPVVCTDAGGLPENVADGETGFVVPRRRADLLAEKLMRLAGDPNLRQRMGEAGRRRVLSHFNLPDQIDAFERLYRQAFDLSAVSTERTTEECALPTLKQSVK